MPFDISAPQNDVPEGTYKAILESVEIIPTMYGDSRRWNFLADVNGVGTPITGITSMNTGPRSSAFKWLAALLKREPATGEHIDDPIGSTVLIKVETNVKNGFPKITELAPYVDAQTLIDGVPR